MRGGGFSIYIYIYDISYCSYSGCIEGKEEGRLGPTAPGTKDMKGHSTSANVIDQELGTVGNRTYQGWEAIVTASSKAAFG